MPLLADLESRFSRSLLDPLAPVPRGVTAWNGAVRSRFAVYRNNVVVGLVDALAKRFPVCRRLVGDEFFRAMAAEFVRTSPPRSPLMQHYGAGFPDFVATFPPAAPVPYLGDVARLEHAYGCAYHAVDAAPLAPQRIEALSADTWERLVFTLHPSLQLVSSRFPIVAIWATNTHDAEVKPVDLVLAEDALVVRPALEVTVRVLPAGGHAFLTTIRSGASLGEAAAVAQAVSPAFDLTPNIVGLVGAGLAVDVRLAGSVPPAAMQA